MFATKPKVVERYGIGINEGTLRRLVLGVIEDSDPTQVLCGGDKTLKWTCPITGAIVLLFVSGKNDLNSSLSFRNKRDFLGCPLDLRQEVLCMSAK